MLIENRTLELMQTINLPFTGELHLIEGYFAGNGTTECVFPFNLSLTGNKEMYDTKKLLKLKDVLGREVIQENEALFFIYDDGTVEKKIIIE